MITVEIKIYLNIRLPSQCKVRKWWSNDRMSVNILPFFRSSYLIRLEEAGSVDPETLQLSNLYQRNLSTSHGGNKPLTEDTSLDCKASYRGAVVHCSLHTDIPGFSINIFSLNQVMKFPLLSTIRTFGKTRLFRG